MKQIKEWLWLYIQRPVKRFFRQVYNLIRWFPVIWKDRDWDHHYIFEVLKFKLEKQAKHLSERNWHESSKHDAELMMTCVRLINKLQNEEYYDELYNLDERSPEAIKTAIDKHNKAKRLLFKIMEERIESWWD